MESVSTDMVRPEMVLIGTEFGVRTAPVEKLISFYESIMEKDARYEVGTWDECECIKMFYNTYVTMKITMANMIQDVAVKQGNINVDFVTTALAKSVEKITGPAYMKSGMGDGGCCRPRDNIVLRKLAKDLDLGYDMFDWMMLAREKQAENLAKELVKYAEQVGQPIYIHGKAYKSGVPYCQGSYSLLVGQYCEAMGYNPIYVDPLTKDLCDESTGVILLAHGKEYCPITAGSIVIDPWRCYNNDAVRVIHYGNTRLFNV
jgi:UDPglucose 6-dehydrogenase